MRKYVTTNIRLEESDYRTLKLRAHRDRKSLASLVRDAVRSTYGATPAAQMTEEEWRTELHKLCGIAEGGWDASDVDQIYDDDEGGLKPRGA